MIFGKFALDGDGAVRATVEAPSTTGIVNGAAYLDGEDGLSYACVSTDSVAAADGVIGGFRYTTAGALRVSDVTGGLPASSSVNQGILMTDDGQVCFSGAPGTAVLNGVSLTADGAVSMQVMAFLLEFADLGAGAVDTAVTFGGVSATFTRATTATTIGSTGLVTAVATGVARSYYDPTTLEYLGYLAEGARTNLCLQSEAIGITTWSAFSNGATTANDAISPDGAATADTIVEDSATGARESGQTGVTITADSTVTMSVFVKRLVGVRNTYLAVSDNTNFFRAVFNLTTGAVGETGVGGTGVFTSSSIKEYPNNWWRVAITGKVDAASTSILLFCAQVSSTTIASQSYEGDGASKSAYWGAQLEAAAFASSYIPTTTAAVARNADVLTYPTAGWLNASAGTLYGQAQVPAVASTTFGVCSINDSSADNAIELHAVATNPFFFVEDATATQANIDAGTIAANTTFELIGAYAENDFAACVDGGAVQTDTSGTIPTVDIIHVGTSQNAATPAFGPIRRVAYYPSRLPNATLQSLTE